MAVLPFAAGGTMLLCTYEDRPTDLIGVKLLVSSLARHLPGVPVHVGCPSPGDDLRQWLSGRANVTLATPRDSGLSGWNVKAGLLLQLLERGHREVIWIDSDVIVAGDFRRVVSDETSLIVTQELSQNGPKENAFRTQGWGLEVGRRLPDVVNSAFLRVTTEHIPLVREWIALMNTEPYRDAQRLPIERRPYYMIGDQDVLGALLGATRYAHLPVKFLVRGRDIIHDFMGGYAPADRVANLFRPMPPLVHAQGYKPWRFPEIPPMFREPARFYRFTQVEGSPYPYIAREYRDEFESFPAFLEVRSRSGKMLGALSHHNLHLHGLPHALLASGGSQIKRAKTFVTRAVRFAGRMIR